MDLILLAQVGSTGAVTNIAVLLESHLTSSTIRAIGSAPNVVRILFFRNSYIGKKFDVTHKLKFIMWFLVTSKRVGAVLYVTSVQYLSRHKPVRVRNTNCLFLSDNTVISWRRPFFQTPWRQPFLQQHRQHARHSTQEEVYTACLRIGKCQK